MPPDEQNYPAYRSCKLQRSDEAAQPSQVSTFVSTLVEVGLQQIGPSRLQPTQGDIVA